MQSFDATTAEIRVRKGESKFTAIAASYHLSEHAF